MENDAYVPDAGDTIFYDWSDSGVGDNTAAPDHVGLVCGVSGNTITVIEGNKNDAVGYRNLSVNGRYIRGYGLPNYASKATGGSTATAQDTTTATKSVDELVDEVMKGLWGNGDERKTRLTAAGYDYATVQNAVNARLSGGSRTTKPATDTAIAPASGTADAAAIWNGLMKSIGNAFGVAGLMGNIYAESGLIPNNLQNTGNSRLGMSDAEYTAAVDSGAYTNFVNDSHGYGLCQWTWYSRKQALLNYAKARKASIGNLQMQLDFIVKEMSESYSGVLNTLKTASSVLEASNAVLMKFERPADMGEAVQKRRAAYGQKYFDAYAGNATAKPADTAPTTSTATTKEVKAADYAQSFDRSVAGAYTVTASALNVRDGAGTGKKILVTIPKGTRVNNYGYYTAVGGVKWMYVQFTYNGTTYTGFVSGDYLSR